MSTDMLMLPMLPVVRFSAVAEASGLSSARDKGDSRPGQAFWHACCPEAAAPCLGPATAGWVLLESI